MVASHARAAALAGQAWAEMRDLLDRQLSPLGLQAIEALSPQAGEVIADIGCGAGQTLVQLAARVGAGGQVIGVDIAPVLVAAAQARCAGLGLCRGGGAALVRQVGRRVDQRHV